MSVQEPPLDMSAYSELPVVFSVAGEAMVGICTIPPRPAARGVIVLVGGPQYRVGSHRQFVLLARSLALQGIAVMRFDFSGTGDSAGPDRSFEGRNEEVSAAIDAFVGAVPGVRNVVLWGLCDAASAALFFAGEDARVVGLALLNPWVRSEAGLAKTHLKHYYTARLADRAFWQKLFGGRMELRKALAGWFATLRRSLAASSSGKGTVVGFQTRMATGWRNFSGAILLVASGADLTAKEFLDHVAVDKAWRGLLDGSRVARRDLAEADHTFSSAEWRDQVAAWTAQWVKSL